MKTQNFLTMPIGIILMAIAIIMIKFLPGNNIFDFIEGLLIGLSIALSISYMYTNSKKSKKEL